jgi:hypothetical protein
VENAALDIAIAQFAASASYDMADGYFTSLIKPLLPLFAKEKLLNLVRSIDTNDQIYGRGRAAAHHRLIKQLIDNVFGGEFDYSTYPRFAESVGI